MQKYVTHPSNNEQCRQFICDASSMDFTKVAKKLAKFNVRPYKRGKEICIYLAYLICCFILHQRTSTRNIIMLHPTRLCRRRQRCPISVQLLPHRVGRRGLLQARQSSRLVVPLARSINIVQHRTSLINHDQLSQNTVAAKPKTRAAATVKIRMYATQL